MARVGSGRRAGKGNFASPMELFWKVNTASDLECNKEEQNALPAILEL